MNMINAVIMYMMKNKPLRKYKNGEEVVKLYSDGTRIIHKASGDLYAKDVVLEYPLNIDIRVMTKCSLGLNPITGKAICSFCHESARTDGAECNYEKLKSKLVGLPPIELAIGANSITEGLMDFCKWASDYGFIINLTVNEVHTSMYEKEIKQMIEDKHIYGLGVSFRPTLRTQVPQWIKEHDNTVLHCIAGIDDLEAVVNSGYSKLLVLGEKDFGFNIGNVNLDSDCHKDWKNNWKEKTKNFKVVSFDNLGLQQLNLSDDNIDSWDELYQEENSLYIDAVNEKFKPSSRSSASTDWDEVSIKDYFTIRKMNID